MHFTLLEIRRALSIATISALKNSPLMPKGYWNTRNAPNPAKKGVTCPLKRYQL